MNKVIKDIDTNYYCSFLLNDVEFSFFLDNSFFSKTKLPKKSSTVLVHNHAHHELLLILGSTVFSQINDTVLQIEDQQCVFIPAKTMHSNYSNDPNALVVSLAFTFNKIKTTSKAQSLLSFFTKLFNQPNPVFIKNSKLIFDNYDKLKKHFDNIDMFTQFRIQNLLQEIVLEIASIIQRQTSLDLSIENFSYGKNLPFLINKEINTYLCTKNLTTIAEELFISKRQLERYIKNTFGTTFIERRTYLRIEASKKLLANSNLSIEEIVDKIGFSNKTHFYKKFYEFTGFSPKDYRKTHFNTTHNDTE